MPRIRHSVTSYKKNNRTPFIRVRSHDEKLSKTKIKKTMIGLGDRTLEFNKTGEAAKHLKKFRGNKGRKYLVDKF